MTLCFIGNVRDLPIGFVGRSGRRADALAEGDLRKQDSRHGMRRHTLVEVQGVKPNAASGSSTHQRLPLGAGKVAEACCYA